MDLVKQTPQKKWEGVHMNDMENIALENAKNVEQPTEQSTEQVAQPAKTYTEEEFNQKLDEVLGKKIARREAKIRKEYEKKYGTLENILRAGTGKENVDEIADTFREHYEKHGVQIPKEPTYSSRDIELLARAEADEIIKSGLDDVIEEVDRLADIGLGNMNAREKEVFRTLAEYRNTAERGKELAKIGVTEDVYNSKEFKAFASKFSSNTPITEVYDIYSKMQPKTEVRTMGSMKNTTVNDKGVKEFYTRDEALQFTKQDFDKNPALFKAVEQSMYKW